jgi:hypothetical protein
MHRLALAIGGVTVRELTARLTLREYFDWIAFYNNPDTEPDAGDLTQGQIAAAFGIKRKPKNASPEPAASVGSPPDPHHDGGRRPVVQTRI